MAKKKVTERIPYTEEEIKYILEAPLSNLRDIAFMMRRSIASVRRKKWALENKYRDVQSKLEYKQRLSYEVDPTERRYDIWTKEEEELIMKSKLSDVELAKKLNRSVGSIQVKRNRLVKSLNEKKEKNASKKVRRNNKQG